MIYSINLTSTAIGAATSSLSASTIWTPPQVSTGFQFLTGIMTNSFVEEQGAPPIQLDAKGYVVMQYPTAELLTHKLDFANQTTYSGSQNGQIVLPLNMQQMCYLEDEEAIPLERDAPITFITRCTFNATVAAGNLNTTFIFRIKWKPVNEPDR